MHDTNKKRFVTLVFAGPHDTFWLWRDDPGRTPGGSGGRAAEQPRAVWAAVRVVSLSSEQLVPMQPDFDCPDHVWNGGILQRKWISLGYGSV